MITDEDKVTWKSYLEKALKLSLSMTPVDPLAVQTSGSGVDHGLSHTVVEEEDNKLFAQALNHCKHQV